MTFAGKLFVMFNMAISFLMAFGAFGLYATNLDYDFDKGKNQQPQPPARVTELQTQITQAASTMPAVNGAWRAARTELLTREEQRRQDHVWYDQQMKLLVEPLDKTSDKQVATVVLANHLPVLDATNRPTMAPAVDRAGQPLLTLTTYNLQAAAARKDNKDVLDRLSTQITEDIRLTNLLTGTTDPFTKGLRRLLVEEREKREGLEAELRSVRPLFINTAVETALIQKRLDALQERIVELKTFLQKKHKVDLALRSR